MQCRGDTLPRVHMKTVIFDLDNCLCPTTESGADLYDPAFTAIRIANDGSVADQALASAFSEMWSHAYDWVARKYCFTPAMIDAGWQALSQVEVNKPLVGYADLHLLATVPAERFLVTSGFRRLQESKIRALGIAAQFRKVFVDAIDVSPRAGKYALFQEIIAQYALEVSDVVVVGDNPESELAAARSLGLVAVQILRPGVAPSEVATEYVRDLHDLISWLHRR